MTKMKLDYRLQGQASEALAAHVDRIYRDPGSVFLAIVEFRHSERIEYADEDAEPSVKCRVASMEVASSGEQEDQVRALLRALFLRRTAQGTLDDAGEVKLSKQTITSAAGVVGGAEIARLRGALGWVAATLHEATSNTDLRDADLRKALGKIEARLAAALRGEQLDLVPTP